MKNTNVKKTASIIIAVATCFNTISHSVLASHPQSIPDSGIVSPMNIAISSYTHECCVESSGIICYGQTNVKTGYTASVIVELQQKNGTWSTIKTWSNSKLHTATVDEIHKPAQGYDYRLKLTFKAYTTNNVLVESFTEYSDIVSY